MVELSQYLGQVDAKFLHDTKKLLPINLLNRDIPICFRMALCE